MHSSERAGRAIAPSKKPKVRNHSRSCKEGRVGARDMDAAVCSTGSGTYAGHCGHGAGSRAAVATVWTRGSWVSRGRGATGRCCGCGLCRFVVRRGCGCHAASAATATSMAWRLPAAAALLLVILMSLTAA